MRLAPLLLALFLVPALARADITAKLRMRSPMLGEAPMDGLWYQKGSRIRQEMTTPAGKMILLTAPADGGLYVLQPEAKSYYLAKGGASSTGVPDLSQCVGASGAECLQKSGFRRVGAETVNGIRCDTWEKVSNQSGQRGRLTLARPESGQMPFLRASWSGPAGDEITVEVVSFKEGPVAASLFELPTGYKKRESFLPPGFDGGKQPSREQIDQLLKQYRGGKPFEGLDLGGADATDGALDE